MLFPHHTISPMRDVFIHLLYISLFVAFMPSCTALGSMSTVSASYDSNGRPFICGITQGSTQGIQCWDQTTVAPALPAKPFSGVTGGKGFFCGIRQDTGRPFCWTTSDLSSPKRIKNLAFSDIVAGTSQICALSEDSSFPSCWRNQTVISSTPVNQSFVSIAAGDGFVCGITNPNKTITCWGSGSVVDGSVPSATFDVVEVGAEHACGLTPYYNVQCWGNDTYGQLKAPQNSQFLALALGDRHSCGIDAFSRHVTCWGDNSLNQTSPVSENLSFWSITAGNFFTCGVLQSNYSVFCWGASFGNGMVLPLNSILPGSCTNATCDAGKSFQQQTMCYTSDLHVCTPCRIGCGNSAASQIQTCTADHDIVCPPGSINVTGNAPNNTTNSSNNNATSVVYVTRNKLSKGLLALIIICSIGALWGVLTTLWCIWAKFYGPLGFSFDGSQGRVHNSTAAAVPTVALTRPPSRAMRRQKSLRRSPSSAMRRQRSSTSSMRGRGELPPGRAQSFSIAEMVAATMDFSEDNKIGEGSFGGVYRGVLTDGRLVAIKRRAKDTLANDKKMEEKESAFESELEFLSRLHHKHLVSLVGYCDEEDERMLVYDFMPNGTLHDHLHGKPGSSMEGTGDLPWQMRIKIALEAARGVEYLHTYAMPPIIHRDIKSSNILLDQGWNARVSDFGLSILGPAEHSHLSLMAAGTLGYMDPEYYRLQHLTIKSDVYSFGVVLLEMLTGERAIHKQSHGPVNIVDFAVPKIVTSDLGYILDKRPIPPTPKEFKALDLVARVAAACVRLEGKERPNMTDIVAVLEEALATCSTGRSRSHSASIAAGFSAEPVTSSLRTRSVKVVDPPFEAIEGLAGGFQGIGQASVGSEHFVETAAAIPSEITSVESLEQEKCQ